MNCGCAKLSSGLDMSPDGPWESRATSMETHVWILGIVEGMLECIVDKCQERGW